MIIITFIIIFIWNWMLIHSCYKDKRHLSLKSKQQDSQKIRWFVISPIRNKKWKINQVIIYFSLFFNARKTRNNNMLSILNVFCKKYPPLSPPPPKKIILATVIYMNVYLKIHEESLIWYASSECQCEPEYKSVFVKIADWHYRSNRWPLSDFF